LSGGSVRGVSFNSLVSSFWVMPFTSYERED
jgi:hypothetical protein